MRSINTILCMSASALLLFLGSCKARFYTPNRNPVPMYRSAGDGYIDASTNLFNKVDLTAGIAPFNGLGTYIGYSGSYHSSSTDNNDSITGDNGTAYRGNMLNLGLGYFVTEDISKQFRFEIYGDLGLGDFKNKVSGDETGEFNGKYTRIGIMPNFGYHSIDNQFHFAYSVRFSNISFGNPFITNAGYWSDDLKRYNSRSSYNMVEQAMLFRVGSDKVKFQLQLGSYHGLDSDDVLNAIPRWNASIMVGVVFQPKFY